jgi:uracil-DNA glycosylase family 4
MPVMDDIFKQKLLKLRSPVAGSTFAQALMGESFLPSHSGQHESPASEGFTEKRQVIESLERFAREKVEKAPEPVIRFDRGEIHVKADPVWDNVSLAQDTTELLQGLSLEKEITNVLFKGKTSGKIQVMFVTENIRPWAEVEADLKGGFIDELLTGFPLKTAEFFERMILAMKLDPSEVMIYPVEIDETRDLSAEVVKIAVHLKPELLITLGAKATQKILKSNDRLSLIHGQFHERKVENQSTLHIVPLFHPSILETNQNMKKTAWADMQKIMKHLKKIP